MGIHTQPVVAEWVELLTGGRDVCLAGAPAPLRAGTRQAFALRRLVRNSTVRESDGSAMVQFRPSAPAGSRHYGCREEDSSGRGSAAPGVDCRNPLSIA